jgi:hypothetical protein
VLGDRPFAQCALDEAAHDLWGKRLGRPVYELWGLSTRDNPPSDYTIGIDAIDVMVEKLRQFPGFPVYKIKLGTAEDLAIVRELRRHTDATFRVDANCGWTAEQTIANSRELKQLGVEFIEREFGWVRTRQVMAELADHGAAVIGAALQPHVTSQSRIELPTPTPSMRLVRLPDGLGRTREDADELRMQILDRTGVETAFTSFDGVGYLRLSVHLYTEPSDFEVFVDRCVPLIVELASHRKTTPPPPSTT